MTTIVTRAGKGSALTWTEADANFTNLNTDKLELSGGIMTGTIAFSDTGEGIDFSNGTQYYDIDASNIHAVELGANNTGVGWYSVGNLRGICYTPTAYSGCWGQGVTSNRTWGSALAPVHGFASGASGQTSLINFNGTSSYLIHGAYVDSDLALKYTTAATTPAYIALSGGQVIFNVCTSSGTPGNAVTFINPLTIDNAGGSAGSVNLNSGQLKFPASQIASADANTLDDYEEGTWTPTVTPGSGSITAYTASGTYTKIGRQVSVQITVTITTAGTAGGAMGTTLPFANSAIRAAGSGVEAALTGFALYAYIAPSASTISTNKYDGTGLWANGQVHVISATYFV